MPILDGFPSDKCKECHLHPRRQILGRQSDSPGDSRRFHHRIHWYLETDSVEWYCCYRMPLLVPQFPTASSTCRIQYEFADCSSPHFQLEICFRCCRRKLFL